MDTIIEVKGIRKVIAAKMLESWHTSPRVAYTVSIDTSMMKQFSQQWNEKNNNAGIRLSMNHIMIRACALTMKEHPYINSSFDGKNIILHNDMNIGLAVEAENGLIVPNMKNVEKADLLEISQTVNALIEKARTAKISLDDVTGGTFTITNLGPFGIESFTPIINQPECAILGISAAINTPVVVDNKIVIRPMMSLTLVADHRVIDGAFAARFLNALKERLKKCDDI